MAKKVAEGDVNKSQLVRDILAKDPTLPVKDIVSALAERDIKITPNLVYALKAKMNGAGSSPAPGKSSVIRRRQAPKSDAASLIKDVERLVGEYGGEQLKKAIDFVENL